MRLPSLLSCVAALICAACLVGCGGPDEIRTVADFDDNPCGLFTDDVFTGVVSAPYRDLAGVEPTLLSAKASDSGTDTHACTYSFEGKQTQVPEVRTFTVTVAHAQSANQPLAICQAGAASRSPGYKIQQIGDGGCTDPNSDLWLRLGEHYFHVVVVPQPGFVNPVDRSFALSPMLLAVGTATASRMPKS
jgi:hypothetical protein